MDHALTSAVEERPAYFSAHTAEAKKLLASGFLRRDFGFDLNCIDEAAAITAKIRDAGKRRAQDLWRRSSAVQALACDEGVLSVLSALFGRRAFPFQTLNFVQGSEQKAHADTIHFSSSPSLFMCGVWIALEDVDLENGPLFYYEGSHRLPVFSVRDIGGDDYVSDYEPFVAKALTEGGFEKKTALMKKGDAFIWSANLFHGGSAIIDKNRTRLSQVTHYYFEDCCYMTPIREKQGRPYIREVYDFSTDAFVKQRMNGAVVRPSPQVALAARYRNLIKQSLVS